MNKAEQTQTLLEYYRDVAYILGLKKDAVLPDTEGEQKKHDPNTQENFSLFWFYDLLVREFMNPNPLASAFLGNDGKSPLIQATSSYDIRTVENEFLENSDLNKSQIEAISHVLVRGNPVSFIQGPPGTGKTHTILNMVSCILGFGKTVAVVSSNHAALNNIAGKVKSAGKSDLKPNLMRLAEKYAKLGNSVDRDEWSKEDTGNRPQFIKTEREFVQANSELTLSVSGWESKIKAEEFLRDYPFITCTFHSLMKCFANGDTYQYDYIIIDEASQCSVTAGIIALVCAKSIIIVGDEEQLSPVHDDSLNSKLPVFPFSGDILNQYLVYDKQGDGQSILTACQKVFSEAPKTLLNEHYRCHPGIIEFCNKNVYGRKLLIKTKDYDKNIETPIKVLWYEGDYCEGYWIKQKRDSKKKNDYKDTKPTKCNMKQVTIFMEEEWPYLQKKFEENPNYSVCILSPFRGQLESLEDRINGYCKKPFAEITDISGESFQDKAKRKDEESITDISNPAMLTIHKSQGQEFDLVYLLPVEDGDWEWPWSQGKKLVNVAVSRAMKELRLIVSSCLMREDIQRELTGKEPVAPTRNSEISNEQREQEEVRQWYIKKLIECVYDRVKSDEVYGFHKTRFCSVFDDIPRYQPRHNKNSDWAPEECMKNALIDMNLEEMGLSFVRNVPLSECFPKDDYSLREALKDGVLIYNEIESVNITVDEKIEHIRKNGTHFDYVLYDKSTRRIIMVIEVDGAHHRHNRNKEELIKKKKNDAIKDSIAKDFGAEVFNGINKNSHSNRLADKEDWTKSSFILLRLPTDGSSYMEADAMLKYLNADRQNEDFLRISESFIEDYSKYRNIFNTGNNPGITKCLEVWQQRDELFNNLTPPEVNKRLRDEGFISGSTEDGWIPTERGENIGIVRNDANKKGYKPRCLYTQAAFDYLFEHLKEVIG